MIQINKSYEVHKALEKELTKSGRQNKDLKVDSRFWDTVQEVLQTLVMKHLDIYEQQDTDNYGSSEVSNTKSLFRFDGTNCVSTYSARLTSQPIQTICKPEPYNIIPIFKVLNSNFIVFMSD